MNFKEQLVDSGRLVGEMVAANVGNNPQYFSQIVEMVFYEQKPMQSRAGRVFCLCASKYPYLVEPHIDMILENAQKVNYMHRSFLWTFAEVDLKLTEEQEGILLDLCFEWLNDRKLDIAGTVFCFTVIFNFVKKEPDLGPELAEIIKSIIPHGSPGVKNRGTKILQKMKKMGII